MCTLAPLLLSLSCVSLLSLFLVPLLSLGVSSIGIPAYPRSVLLVLLLAFSSSFSQSLGAACRGVFHPSGGPPRAVGPPGPRVPPGTFGFPWVFCAQSAPNPVPSGPGSLGLSQYPVGAVPGVPNFLTWPSFFLHRGLACVWLVVLLPFNGSSWGMWTLGPPFRYPVRTPHSVAFFLVAFLCFWLWWLIPPFPLGLGVPPWVFLSPRFPVSPPGSQPGGGLLLFLLCSKRAPPKYPRCNFPVGENPPKG